MALCFAIFITFVAFFYGRMAQAVYQVSSSPLFNSGAATGSLRGGAVLYIRGAGFEMMGNGLSVSVGSFSCVINDYYTTESNLVCKMPEGEYGDADITLSVIVYIMDVPYTCSTTSNCNVRLMIDRSPNIKAIYPQSTVAGSNISLSGFFYSSSTDSLREIKIGKYNCMIDEEMAKSLNAWDSYAQFICRVPDEISPGDYNMTVTASQGTGFATSFVTSKAFKVGFEQTPFNVRIHPVLDSLSAHSGYVHGQILTLTGKGFGTDPSKLTVEYKNLKCKVLTVSDTQVKCELEADLSPVTYLTFIGGAGLEHRLYSINAEPATLKAKANYPNNNSPVISISLNTENRLESETYSQRFSGLFFAPKTGTYTFYLSSDDYSSLYFSSTPFDSTQEFDESTLTRLCYIEGYTGFRSFYQYSSQRCSINLIANKYYYFVALHNEGYGGDHISIGVTIPNSDNSLPNTKPAVKKIQIRNTPVREVISYKLYRATGGTYKLKFKALDSNGKTLIDVTTNEIAFDATASVVSSAINSVTGYNINVVRTMVDTNGIGTTAEADKAGFKYQITFNSYRSPQPLPFLVTAGLQGSVITSSERLVESSPPVRGDFKIQVGEYVSQSISYSSSGTTIQAYLLNLPPFKNGVSVIDMGNSNDGKTWIIRLDSVKDNPEFTFAVNTITGGPAESPAELIVDNEFDTPSSDLFYLPIPSDLLYTFSSQPEFKVKVGDYYAACTSRDCAYSIKEIAKSPVIESFSLTGLDITITLAAGYDSLEDAALLTQENLSVTFSKSPCTITSVALPIISCTLPANSDSTANISAGSHLPKIHLKNRGFFAATATPTSHQLSISSIAPTAGSIGGGTPIIITGTGFSAETIVTVNSNPCQITSITNIRINCKTPAQGTTNAAAQIVVTEELLTSTDSTSYNYSAELTPTIIALTPASASPVLKNNLVITASGLGTQLADLTISLHGQKKDGSKFELPCNPLSLSDTDVTCRLGGGPSGNYKVAIMRTNVGLSIATPETANNFSYSITVSEITPKTGSKAGGQRITITGTNFSSVLKQNQVMIGKTACNVISATSTQIIAEVPSVPADATEMTFPIYVIGRVVEEAVCDSSVCTFTYEDSNTPIVSAINPSSGIAGTSVTISGSVLDGAGIQIKLNGVLVTEITNQTPISVTFNVPNAKYFKGPISVYIPQKGNASVSSTLTFENLFEVTDVNPKGASIGGDQITINGNGFDLDAATVKVGTVVCNIIAITNKQISCWFENLASYSTGYVVNVTQNGSTMTCSTCKYTTSTSSLQPKITSISPTSFTNSDSVQLTIGGTLLGTIGTVTGQLISKSNPKKIYTGVFAVDGATMTWTFSSVPAGDYKLIHKIADVGFALISSSIPAISVAFSDADFTADIVQVSFAGGYSYSLTGKGLLDLTELPSSAVKVCGISVKVTQSSYGSMTFEVPPLITEASNTLFKLASDGVIAPNAITTLDNSASQGFVNDGNFSTYFSSSSNNCWIKYDYGDKFKAHVSMIKLFPYVMDSASLVGGKLEGSNDDTNWTTLVTITKDIVTNWNSYVPSADVATPWNYRYIRFFGNKCRIAELNVHGIVYREGGDGTSDKCDVEIIVNSKTLLLTEKIEYRSDKTPSITSITPSLGSTAGGSEVIITGTGFDPAIDSIKFDDIPCVINIAESTTTSLKCITGPRPTFVPSTVKLSTASGLASPKGKVFLYIDRWSDEQTWFGESFPREGDSVYVPVGQNLLIDVTPPKIYALIIEGSTVWDDSADYQFDASFIVVRGGSLQIGTKENPHTHKLTITLHGKYETNQLPIVGNKHISVHGGKLDIHGLPKTPTWTLLGASVSPGATTITLVQAVNWSVGDEIVIASTSFSRDEFERRLITQVSGDGLTLTIDKPLDFAHFAETLTYDGKSFEVRAEVAVLTRNVRVIGDSDSDKLKYGAHIMMMGRDIGLRGRISYIEMFRCGQAFQMGRYPIHFHLAGNVIDSYVEGCSVHDSFNRGTTVHGVHYLVVKNNVYLNHMGHGIFIEDSIESNNVIDGNLVMRTSTSASLLISDLKPAGIWITRPKNFFRNNHAAGSTHFGFWFDLPSNPTGPSATNTICPSGEPLGQFHNNVAHTNGIGLRVYPIYIPRTDPCGAVSNYNLADPFSQNPSVIAEFTDNLFFANSQGFFGRNIGAIQLKNTAFISNGQNAVVAEPDATNLFVPRIENSIFVGKVNSWYALQGVQSSGAFKTGRRDGFLLKNNHFIDFPSGSVMFSTCDGCGDEMHRDIGARQTNFQQLTFTNINAKWIDYDDPDRDKDIFYDLDGSLIQNLGIADSTGGWVVPYFKHLEVPGCTTIITDTTICSNKCLICDKTVTLRRVNLRIPSSLFDGLDLKILNYDITDTMSTPENFQVIKFRSVTNINWKGWAVPFVSSHKYNLHWSTGLDFAELRVENSRLFEASDAGFFLRVNNTLQREVYDGLFSGLDQGTYKSSNAVAMLSQAPTASSFFGDFYYTNTTNTSLIRIDGNRLGTFIYTAVICRLYCPVDPGAAPISNEIRFWSDPSSWPTGKVPVANELVVVDSGWNIILDISPPDLDKLTIRGKLSFDLEKPTLTLTVKNIEITNGGILQIGNSTNPYTNKASIVLKGDRTDPQIIIDPLIDPATKSIVVKGEFTVFGPPKTPVTVRLSETALAGSTTIVVNQNTNWAVGDELVIAASSRNPEHVDYVTITAVQSGTIFTITPALLYDHYGAADRITTKAQRTLDMRAEVSVLNRNVVIKGTSDNNWGCRVLIAGYDNSDVNPVQKIRGFVNLNNVEFNYCGQKDTEHGALDFVGAIEQEQRVIGCSIRNGLGWGINMDRSQNLFFDNNVISSQTKIGVHLRNSQDVVFQYNVITKVNNRTDYYNIEFFDLIHGFYYNDQRYMKVSNVTIKHNIISSTWWFAWFVPGYDCAETDSNFFNNTGHSSRAGWFGMKLGKDCMKFSDFIAYHNFDEGFVQRFDLRELIVTRMLLADNDNSIVINGGDSQGRPFPKVTFSNSEVFGQVLKDCSFCYKTSDTCKTNGLYTSLLEETAFMMSFEENRLPLHNVTDTEFLWGGVQTIDNVEFSEFRTTTVCNNNFPIRANNFVQDTSVFVNMTNVKYTNIDYDNTIFFFNHTRPKNPSFCGKRDCTGIYNLIISDNTGGIFGSKMSFFGFNKPAGREGNCTFVSKWNGHVCNPVYALLSVQQPLQARAVVISPITVTLYDGKVPNVSDDLQYMNTVDNERKLPIIVKKFSYHHIKMQGTIPTDVIYKLDSDTPTDWAVFRMQHNDPSTMITLVNDVRVAPKIVGDDQTYDFTKSKCGDHVFFPSNRTIIFYIDAQPSCVVKVSIIPSIQLSLRIDIKPLDFYKNNGPTTFIDNISALLGISSDRIRIVSILTGSTIINFIILPDSSAALTNSAGSVSQIMTELTQIQSKITAAVATGNLNAGAPILDINFSTTTVPKPAQATPNPNTLPNILTVCRYNSTKSFELTNIHWSSFNNGTIDILCMNCVNVSECAGANLVNACYQNRTVLGESECSQFAFCPYLCRDFSPYSYCAYESGQHFLRNLADACTDVCTKNGTFSMNQYSYCDNSNCTLNCSASRLVFTLLMVFYLVFFG